MEPDRGFTRRLGGPDHVQHLLQGHLRTVVDLTALSDILQQLRVHQTAGVDHHIRLAQQPGSPDGDKVRRPAARSYKVNHTIAPPLIFRGHSFLL